MSLRKKEEQNNQRLEIENLRQKIHFFENALSNSIDQIFIFDKEGRFLYLNSAGAETLGQKKSKLIGKNFKDVRLPKNVIDPLDYRFNAVSVAKKPITGVIEFPVDETLRYFEYKLNPIIDEKGELESILVISRDITERKLAEEVLSENDYFNQSLLRLYKSLGKASTYREIVNALNPEIKIILGYNAVYLQLLQGDGEGNLLMLDAGGPIEATVKDILKSFPNFEREIGGETFYVLPIDGDKYLIEASQATHVHVIEDARTHPLTNKEIVKVSQNRTMVVVPLTLAEKRLGILGTGTYGDEGVLVPTKRQIDYLETLSNHVAVALDRVSFLAERHEAEKKLKEKQEIYQKKLEKINEELKDCKKRL